MIVVPVRIPKQVAAVQIGVDVAIEPFSLRCEVPSPANTVTPLPQVFSAFSWSPKSFMLNVTTTGAPPASGSSKLM